MNKIKYAFVFVYFVILTAVMLFFAVGALTCVYSVLKLNMPSTIEWLSLLVVSIIGAVVWVIYFIMEDE